MLRGILLGSVWGLVLGGGFLAIMSLTYPATVLPPPQTESDLAVAAPRGEPADPAPVGLPATVPAPLDTPERHDAARITRPDHDTLAAIDPVDLDPGEAPDLPAPDIDMGAGPDAAPSRDLTAPAPESSVLPNPLAVPPTAPEAEDGPVIVTEPRQPPRADPDAEITGFPMGDLTDTATAPDPVVAPGGADTALPSPPSDPAPMAQTADPAAPGGDEVASADEAAPGAVATADAPVIVVETPEAVDQPDPDDLPDQMATATPLPDASDAAGDAAPAEGTDIPDATDDGTPTEMGAPVTDAETALASPDAAQPSAETDDADTDPTDQTDAPQPAEPEADPSPRIIVLESESTDANDSAATPSLPGTPGIRLTEDAPAPAPTPDAAPTPDLAADADLPPIDRYAQPFQAPEGMPIVSIVLLDSAADGATTDMPSRFPYLVSIAVPIDAPDAEARMRRYRDAGYEVLALANLPENATPDTISQATTAWIKAVPEAVAIMERPTNSLQSSRQNGEALAAALAESGHGLVLFPDGLDTTRKLATRRGVPAATVFRDLDGAGQGEAVIRRFLDHSAFKASVEGAVILVTRLRPDTLEALLVWGLADRANRVALAPVSAALKASSP